MVFQFSGMKNIKKSFKMSIWPWSDLVTAVMRLRLPASTRVLELGCGAGANIPFFKHLGMDYHAVEGSPVIVEQLHERFPEYTDTIKCGDFTKEILFDGCFDLIVDRASVTCNSSRSIYRVVDCIQKIMHKGAYYVGIDWYSDDSSYFNKGDYIDDFTRANFQDGPFADLGTIHFSSEGHIRKLFKKFKLITLEKKRMKLN